MPPKRKTRSSVEKGTRKREKVEEVEEEEETSEEQPEKETEEEEEESEYADDDDEDGGVRSSGPSPGHPFTALRLSQVCRLIEPGPILLVSTGSVADGSHNLMTMGFHMMVQHGGPTLIGACIGPWDASYATLRSQRQCVLAVPGAEMAETVVDIGNCSKDDDDLTEDDNKWTRFGLEPLPAQAVKPPLVGGPHILANIECVVHDRALVGKYALWILKAVRAWWDEDKVEKTGRMLHHRGNGVFRVSPGGGQLVDLHERMTKWPELAE